MDLLQRFEEAGHDGHDLRPTTFWSWNGRLDPEEVRRQVREMAKAGLGGHFMHARRGLDTIYMGPEWMDAVRAAIEEARHTDVSPWLYDEDCWPSGTCSGRVYAGHEHFQAKYLVCEEISTQGWEPTERTVAVFRARRDPRTTYRDFRLLDDPRRAFSARLQAGEVLLHFVYRTDEYVDTLNRDATAEFLKRTHEVYREAAGREFGRLIPGLFTDEPMYGRNGHCVPWSLELPRFFQRSTGGDLVARLPELFYPVGAWRKARFDFYESLTRLFLLAWTMPVYQWCARHHLALTGHVMAEDTLLGQVAHVGAAMPHYEYMHMPGIDHLGRGLGSPVLPKQAASVAAQLGRPRVLSEMFGGAGWNVRFDDLRWVAEWQFVLGVNLVCQHLASYTLRGERKRDFPPSLHYHQPWWPHYYLWNDYAARLLAVLTAGTPVADVLVIHPIASAWAEYSPLDHAAVRDLDRRLLRLTEAVLAFHADFHFGDELILERHGRVEKGELVVGAGRYRTVVVPDATNLRAPTLRLLERFSRSKGTIVFAGRVPEHVDGVPSKGPADLAKRSRRADPATARGRAALRRVLAPQVEVRQARGRDAETVLCQWRRHGRDHIFFLLNTADKPVKARLRLPAPGGNKGSAAGAGRLVRLDANTGRSWQVKATLRGGRFALGHEFGPRESLLLVAQAAPGRGGRAEKVSGPFSPEGPQGASQKRVLTPFPSQAAADLWGPPPAPPGRRKVLGGRWQVRRRDPNALVLDVAQWRSDEGEYSEPMNVLDIQRTLMRNGAEEMVGLRLEFHCAIKDLKGRRFELVLEEPQSHEMWVGGMRTPLSDAGPYWDAALRRVDITPYVRQGVNVVELRRPWHISPRRRAVLQGLASGWDARTAAPEVEIEAIYLVGDFAVAFRDGSIKGPNGSRWMHGRPRLVEEPPTATKDLVRAGYPFFAGRMRMVKDVVLKDRPSPEAVLVLPPFDAVTATVEVNGQEAGTVWKAPRAVAVGELVSRGMNRIGITLTTSLRNLLGPHHHAGGELHWVGPDSFAGSTGRFGRGPTVNRDYRPEYNVVNFGLGGDVVLYW